MFALVLTHALFLAGEGRQDIETFGGGFEIVFTG